MGGPFDQLKVDLLGALIPGSANMVEANQREILDTFFEDHVKTAGPFVSVAITDYGASMQFEGKRKDVIPTTEKRLWLVIWEGERPPEED